MSSVGTGQMSAVETGQMSSAETRLMQNGDTGQRPVLPVDICLVSAPVLARTGKLINVR